MFARLLDPNQWFFIQERLTKKEMALFRAVVDAKRDDQVPAAYKAFTEGVSTDKLAELWTKLNPEQIGHLEKLGEMLERLEQPAPA